MCISLKFHPKISTFSISYAVAYLQALKVRQDGRSGTMVLVRLWPSHPLAWLVQQNLLVILNVATSGPHPSAVDSAAVVWAQCDELFRWHPYRRSGCHPLTNTTQKWDRWLLLSKVFLTFLTKFSEHYSRKIFRGFPYVKHKSEATCGEGISWSTGEDQTWSFSLWRAHSASLWTVWSKINSSRGGLKNSHHLAGDPGLLGMLLTPR